jgi:hypothetical protein
MPGLCRFRMYMHKAVSRGLSGYDFKILQRALERLFLVGGRGLDTGTNGIFHALCCLQGLTGYQLRSQSAALRTCMYLHLQAQAGTHPVKTHLS